MQFPLEEHWGANRIFHKTHLFHKDEGTWHYFGINGRKRSFKKAFFFWKLGSARGDADSVYIWSLVEKYHDGQSAVLEERLRIRNEELRGKYQDNFHELGQIWREMIDQEEPNIDSLSLSGGQCDFHPVAGRLMMQDAKHLHDSFACFFYGFLVRSSASHVPGPIDPAAEKKAMRRAIAVLQKGEDNCLCMEYWAVLELLIDAEEKPLAVALLKEAALNQSCGAQSFLINYKMENGPDLCEIASYGARFLESKAFAHWWKLLVISHETQQAKLLLHFGKTLYWTATRKSHRAKHEPSEQRAKENALSLYWTHVEDVRDAVMELLLVCKKKRIPHDVAILIGKQIWAERCSDELWIEQTIFKLINQGKWVQLKQPWITNSQIVSALFGVAAAGIFYAFLRDFNSEKNHE
jgi:hypothetical protein